MICAADRKDEFRERHRLLARHDRQFASLTDDDIRARAGKFAVTFRPGDHTASFYNNAVRPIGVAVAVVLSYDPDGREIIVGGYRAVDGVDGVVRYGLARRPEFQFDVRPRPARAERAARLYVERNPSLVELGLRMDHVLNQRTPASPFRAPEMPRILFGFPPSRLPDFVRTPALEQLAADQAGVSRDKLASNPPELVDRLLRQVWEQVIGDPATVDSQTGLLLIDAELCHPSQRPLRVFEDFRRLIGDWAWNPARELKIPSALNDAAARLAAIGVGAGELDQVPQPTIDALLSRWRLDLGEHAVLFSDEDFYDALLEPSEALIACTAAVAKMRKRLTTYWNETATDFDLRQAAHRPYEALFASGACRVQVLRRRTTANSLRFTPDDLGRRIDVDWRPIVWPSKDY